MGRGLAVQKLALELGQKLMCPPEVALPAKKIGVRRIAREIPIRRRHSAADRARTPSA
jgi:hypothetical protein